MPNLWKTSGYLDFGLNSYPGNRALPTKGAISFISFLNSNMDIVKQGQLLLEQRDYLAAIDCFAKALKLDPANSELWRKRSFCYYQLGYTLHSTMDATTAFELNPSKSTNSV